MIVTTLPPLSKLQARFELDADGTLIRHRHPKREDFRRGAEFGIALKHAGKPAPPRPTIEGQPHDAGRIIRALKRGCVENERTINLPNINFQQKGPTMEQTIPATEACRILRADYADARGRSEIAIASARALAAALDHLGASLMTTATRAEVEEALAECRSRGGSHGRIAIATLADIVRGLETLTTRVA